MPKNYYCYLPFTVSAQVASVFVVLSSEGAGGLASLGICLLRLTNLLTNESKTLTNKCRAEKEKERININKINSDVHI